MTTVMPTVSIVIPCRNEERFIRGCLDSVLKNDFPAGSLEIFVVDGMSEDKSRSIVADYTERLPFIKLLDNPKKTIPAAMNTGIKEAKGKVIMKVDAHTQYPQNYISRCIDLLDRFEADNVGGLVKTLPRDNTTIGHAISDALSHPFGVGNSRFRIGSQEPRWADTAFSGCYRKEVFDKVGLYDENIILSEDIVLNSKLRKSGGRILLDPGIVSLYFARSDWKSFWRHNWRNGLWSVLPLRYTKNFPFSLRHFVPLGFLLSLIFSAVLSLPLFLLILGAYLLTNLGFSAALAIRKKRISYLVVLPLTFTSLHLAYGLGSLSGLLTLWLKRKKS